MKFYKLFCLSFLILSFFAGNVSLGAESPAATQASTTNYLKVSPVVVVNNPAGYLNKNITFDAEFVGYSSLGLDYKPALREASKYISVLIKRSDVTDHVIPLSEMKIFMTRELAEKHMTLEQGDKIKISAKVFSTALGDPWLDVVEFKVLTKKEKKDIEK